MSEIDDDTVDYLGDTTSPDGQVLELPEPDADPGDQTDGAGEIGDTEDYEIPDVDEPDDSTNDEEAPH